MTPSDWPLGSGEAARLVRRFDWSATCLGPSAHWPQSLRTTVEIVLNSPIAMVLMCEPDHVMIYNDAYALIAGARHPRALGGTVPDIWPEIWDSWNRGILEAGLRGEIQVHTNQGMRVMRSGTPEDIWFDLYYTPVRDEQQRVAAVLCTVIDITQRVLTEQRQQRNEQALRDLNLQLTAETNSLRDLFRLAPSFMAVLSGPDHRIEFANDAYLKLVGERAVLGRPVADALPEVRSQAYLDLLNRVRSTSEPFVGRQMSVALTDRHGVIRERTLDFIYQPLRNRAGDVTGIFVEGNDVTERAAIEERLHIAQRAGGIGTFEWFPDTGRMEVSDEYRRLWGLPPGTEVTDRQLMSQLEPDDLHKTGFSRLVDGNPLDYTEYRVRRADTGEMRWLARRGEVVEGLHGAPRRYVGACFDITDRKHVEEQLLNLAETLEERVSEEVAERSRAEEALRQAQKMEAVGQLTGGIAHDFNNLLQGIVGSLDLVQTFVARGRLSEVSRFVASAMSSANRAAALTHRLLAFARRQPLDPRPIQANQLVASMEDLLRRSLGVSVHMEMVLAGGLWMTRCDANQLENAILNLAINARDAMPEGGRLTIETCNAHLDTAYAARQRDVTPGQYVCVSVSDTGTGMSADVRSRAFDPFFTTKPLGQGTGLGLSMVYGFARQSEGYAKIYSEASQGTTVKLYLPRYRGDEARDDAPQPAELPAARTGASLLVVEDEDVVRNLVVELLQDQGYEVMEAIDGPGALKFLQSARSIDLLITDIGLPGINGRQLADSARALRPQLKVLFMTGYAENAAMASGFLAPGMQMLTKPFPMATLTSRVAEMTRAGD